MNFFSYEGPFFNTLNRLSDLVILNILWFVCSLPIITIGASTTALYYVTLKIVNQEDAYVAKNFFKSFRQNFIQSTIIWLIMLVFGIFIVGDFFLLPNMVNINSQIYTAMFSILCFVTLVYFMILVYLFPLQAKLENKIRHTFKNALLLSFRHLPTTILLIAILAASLWVMANFLDFAFIWVMIAVAAIVYGCSFLIDRIFKIYIKPESVSEENTKEIETDEA